MLVRDVMVAPVITVGPSATVQEVAKLFLEKQISAVPVLDNNGKLVGIVSEGDLLHRVEAGTERHRSWWLRVLVESDTGTPSLTSASAARRLAGVIRLSVPS